jgi:ABC-type antimicrobial peptide transport system permease subunit
MFSAETSYIIGQQIHGRLEMLARRSAMLLVLAIMILVFTLFVVVKPVSAQSVNTTSTTSSSSLSSFLPPQLAPYSSIIQIVLLFVDGLIIGIAIKKALVSILLIVVGLVLAGFIGLSLPVPGTSNIETELVNFMMSEAKVIGPVLFTFPVFWLAGIAVGLWKG